MRMTHPAASLPALLALALCAAPSELLPLPQPLAATWGGPARAAGRPYIPTEWTSRLRALLDPGPGGLAGGLRLRTVSVDPPEGTYRNARGEWVVRVYAPDQPEAAHAAWRGQRVAVVVARTDLPPAASGRALASLTRLLQAREHAWGWLRRAPRAAQASPAEDPAVLLARGERALALGDLAGAAAAARAATKGPSRPLAASLHAARLLLQVGARQATGSSGHGAPERAREEGRLLAARTADRAARALAAERTVRGKSSLLAALAGARALAGQPAAALDAGRPATSGRWACATAPVARDLALAGPGGVDAARRWLGRVITRAPRCATAYLIAYDLAVEAGDDTKARAVAQAAVAQARGRGLSAAVAAAQALRTGHPVDAAGQARAALEADATTPRAVEVLFLAGLSGGDALAPTRPPFSVSRTAPVLRAVGCLLDHDGACAAKALDEAGRPGRRAPLETLPLRAAAVALGGAGEAAMSRAWAEVPRSALTPIAEALAAPDATTRRAAAAAARARTRSRYGEGVAARLDAWLHARGGAPGDTAVQAHTTRAHGGREGAGTAGWLALASLLLILGAVAVTSRATSER